MNAPRKISRRKRGDWWFTIFIVVLLALAFISWLLDPRHRDDGGARFSSGDKKEAHP